VKNLKYLTAVALVLLLVGQWVLSAVKESTSAPANKSYLPSTNIVESQSPASDDNSALQAAFDKKQSNIWLVGSGEVIKILPDDNKGSRHQRFIVKVNLTQTVLIAHNIDLAERLANLQRGDMIQFYGEYEWNEKGGVIHWTHHDPAGKKAGGWIKHNNITYQ
jgi:hypothetical protein